jgi:hypothetical protein
MTLLICPLRKGDNEEMRYAMRSWETNLVTHLDLLVVGDKPDWLHPDVFIPGNPFENSNANVWANVELGCEAAAISDEDVVIMNDDFFCLDPVPGIVAVRRNMTLAEHIALYPNLGSMQWVRSLALTADWLARQGYPSPWSYEVHRPLLCKPAAMLSALSKWDGGFEGDIPQWRTVYGTLNDIDAIPVGDVKMNSVQPPVASGWRSTSDASWRKHGRDLAARFRKPSRWER